MLLLDTFEAASALEGWLRESFLPGLPVGALVVIAGRRCPGEDWRRDPGWRDLLRVLALRNLAPDEARELVVQAGVAGAAVDRLVAITHGHPLALSLLLDVRAQGEEPVALDAVPDVVAALVDGLPGRRPERSSPPRAGDRRPRAGDDRRAPAQDPRGATGTNCSDGSAGSPSSSPAPEGIFPMTSRAT